MIQGVILNVRSLEDMTIQLRIIAGVATTSDRKLPTGYNFSWKLRRIELYHRHVYELQERCICVGAGGKSGTFHKRTFRKIHFPQQTYIVSTIFFYERIYCTSKDNDILPTAPL